jgi:hypothetical protein
MRRTRAELVTDPATLQLVEGDNLRMRKALGHLIELSGLSRREVERRLRTAGCGTDLGFLLGGRRDLKMHHVLAICRVIELEPGEFFDIALKRSPQPPRSPLLQRILDLSPPAREPAAQPSPRPPRPDDLAALIQRSRALWDQLEHLVRTAARMGLMESAPGPAPRPGRPPSPDGPNRLPLAVGGNSRIGAPTRREGGP